MKNRPTSAEQFSTMTVPAPVITPSHVQLARLGLSHVFGLGSQAFALSQPPLSMKDLAELFLATCHGPFYEHHARKIARGLGEETVVQDLTPTQLHRWLNQTKLAPDTRNNLVQFLAMMLKTAQRGGALLKNPLTPQIKKQLLVKITPTEAKILTVDEVARILDEARDQQEARDVLVLIFFGGLSVSQAVGMYYGDIGSVIQVPAELAINAHPWALPCPSNLLLWFEGGEPRSGQVSGLSGNSMGRIIRKIFGRAGIPHPGSIEYTWAAYRRALVGDIAKVYAGRYLIDHSNAEARVPIVKWAEAARYFDLKPTL